MVITGKRNFELGTFLNFGEKVNLEQFPLVAGPRVVSETARHAALAGDALGDFVTEPPRLELVEHGLGEVERGAPLQAGIRLPVCIHVWQAEICSFIPLYYKEILSTGIETRLKF